MKIKCDHCGITKSKDGFYKNNLSKCKECRKFESRNSKISKIDVFNMLENIYNNLNSNNILLNEILIFMKDIKKDIYLRDTNNKVTSCLDIKIDDIENTINRINDRNKKVNDNINTIINYNKCKTKIDEDYEKNLKEIL